MFIRFVMWFVEKYILLCEVGNEFLWILYYLPVVPQFMIMNLLLTSDWRSRWLMYDKTLLFIIIIDICRWLISYHYEKCKFLSYIVDWSNTIYVSHNVLISNVFQLKILFLFFIYILHTLFNIESNIFFVLLFTLTIF